MSYVDGFVLAVPTGNLDAYKAMAEKAAKIWKEHGALEYKECFADDMEDKGFCLTFPAAFQAKPDETVVFAYIVYRSREHRDEVNAKVMADPRLSEDCNSDSMPFDAKRMAYGGFKTVVSF
ncbi:MAG: DUF1428 domain-containing protein [Alphaproteobacteria bacterium]|nr:DUF1428 domain-containing protein [Alphaproteobacteria bacterium]